ncbi:hypothetical protein AC579_1313 [Pseudocercospora musae]|uniref:Uncharacterized protein n=1 Tax=Pseudocercospora musae TaxID=113226 RepID=A0A139I6A0_9PEZI|nr:hypothetical protein AC579_1313 [Pseudocercospora musae]
MVEETDGLQISPVTGSEDDIRAEEDGADEADESRGGNEQVRECGVVGQGKEGELESEVDIAVVEDEDERSHRKQDMLRRRLRSPEKLRLHHRHGLSYQHKHKILVLGIRICWLICGHDHTCPLAN